MNADTVIIKKAFRRLALQYHPDKNKDENFKANTYHEIYEAYSILSNPYRRKQYDIDLFIYKRIHPSIKNDTSEILIDVVKLYYNNYKPNEYFKYHHKLTNDLKQLLNHENIKLLNNNNLDSNTWRIFNYLLKIYKCLNFNELKSVIHHSKDLLLPNKFQNILNKYEQHKKMEHVWTKNRAIFGLFLAIIICYFIYYISK